MSDERVCVELGLPPPGVWAKTSVDECVDAITVASRRVALVYDNSQARQLLAKLCREVAHRQLQEGCGFAGGASEEDPGVTAGSSQRGVGSSQAPELQAASRALQEVGQVSHEEVPPPPPPGSHNSELFPELDTQVFDDDLRDAVNACEADYGGQTEHDADTQEDDDDKKEAEEDDAAGQ